MLMEEEFLHTALYRCILYSDRLFYQGVDWQAGNGIVVRKNV